MADFTATGVSATTFLAADRKLALAITGTFVATLYLERQISAQAWEVVKRFDTAESLTMDLPGGLYRLRCGAFTSGTATYAITTPARAVTEARDAAGNVIFSVDADGDIDGITSGGLFGTKTIVVGKGGDDTAGAASPYTAEFLTIQAAIDAAAAGDTVMVRPGIYTEAVALAEGVRLHGLPGATINNTTNGAYCIRDAAVDLTTAAVTGDFKLTASGGAGCVQISGVNTVLSVECESAIVSGGAGHPIDIAGVGTTKILYFRAKGGLENNGTGTVVTVAAGALCSVVADRIVGTATTALSLTGGTKFTARARTMACSGWRLLADTAGLTSILEASESIIGAAAAGIALFDASGVCSIRAPYIEATLGPVVKITGGVPVVAVEATRKILGDQILDDATSAGATRVSFRAPNITATGAGKAGVSINHASASAEYDIEAAVLVCALDNRATNIGTKLRVRAGKHSSHAGSGSSGLSVQGAAETFYLCDELVGITGAAQAIYAAVTATLHLLGGRIRGLNGDAGGHAILTSGGTVKLRLYPGVVLLAGDDAATESISADNTPTVLCMGDIAVNKAANGGVVEAVGSLLVDAAAA